MTKNGYGKRTPFDNFRVMKHRGGSGVVCQNVNQKTGLLCGINVVSEDDDLMMITNSGILIRTPARDVSLLSRTAGGVIIMRLAEGQSVVNFTKVAREEESEHDGELQDETPEVENTTETAVAETGEN